jgi:carboxypeptidase Taq
MLGVTPENNGDGCLQDIHSAAGLFGYFPTYTLGNIYAAQLFERARKDLPNLEGSLARGEFGELLVWLRERIHCHGQRHQPRKLIALATGNDPDPSVLISSLKNKYYELHGL